MKKTGLEIVELIAKGMVYNKIGLLGDIYVWNNNNYSYERKDGERLYILNLLNEKFEIIEESKVWKPKKDNFYYFVDDCGNIVCAKWAYMPTDLYRYDLGNCFKTKEEGKKAKEKAIIKKKLERYALEHNTEKIDWNNRQQVKWYITLYTPCNSVETANAYNNKDIGQVYFSSKELAEQAIQEIGEDNIKKLFEE